MLRQLLRVRGVRLCVLPWVQLVHAKQCSVRCSDRGTDWRANGCTEWRSDAYPDTMPKCRSDGWSHSVANRCTDRHALITTKPFTDGFSYGCADQPAHREANRCTHQHAKRYANWCAYRCTD